MTWLNYHHLFYFWMVVREGGLTQAARALRLSHPTISAQVHQLEESLGQPLFVKQGRRLALTETGHVVFRYAEEIFTLGREMVDVVQTEARNRPLRLHVGAVDVVPKLVVRAVLEPTLALDAGVQLICREDTFASLLLELSLHKLDVVIADAPVPPDINVRAYSHLLGESGVGFFGSRELVRKARRNFPRSLDGLPFLVPIGGSPLGRALERWFADHNVRPRIVGEFQDSALLKVFGSDGVGLFPVPLAVKTRVIKQYGVHFAGSVTGVKESFYAISAERRLKHPAVVALYQTARASVFDSASR